jgi:hypothetical protein
MVDDTLLDVNSTGWAAIAQSAQHLATGWMVWKSNSSGSYIFCTRPDRSWRPSKIPYSGYQVSLPGVKRLGHGVNHPPSSGVRVKERVQLCLYFPSGPSWPVLGRTLPLHRTGCNNIRKLSQDKWLSLETTSCCATQFNIKYINKGMLILWEASLNLSMPAWMYFYIDFTWRQPFGWNTSCNYLTLFTIK